MGFAIHPTLFSQQTNIDNIELVDGVENNRFGTLKSDNLVQCLNSFVQGCSQVLTSDRLIQNVMH